MYQEKDNSALYQRLFSVKTLELVGRAGTIICLISLISQTSMIREEVVANTFIRSTGDDDGSTCGIDFDTSSTVGTPLSILIGILSVILGIEIFLGAPSLLCCNKRTHNLVFVGQLICDNVLCILFWILLILVIFGWCYTFSINVMDTPIYFTLKSLADSAPLIGCAFQIDAVISAVYLVVALVIARSFLCLVVYTATVRDAYLNESTAGSFEPISTSSSRSYKAHAVL